MATYYPPSLNDGKHVFVFGSNRAGRHGKGAARDAVLHWGAKRDVAEGMTGNAYAIPTKDEWLRTLPLQEVEEGVRRFVAYARSHTDLVFLVTAIGTGLAGYDSIAIAPMFKNAPANCVLPEGWRFSV